MDGNIEFSSSRSRKKSAKWGVFFQYYSFIYSVLLGIIIIPLYLKYIPLNIYGFWLASGNIVAWLTIVDPGLSDVLRQKVGEAYGQGSISKLNSLLTSGVFISLVLSLFIFIIGFFASFYIGNFIAIKDPSEIVIIRKAFILAVISSSFSIVVFPFTNFISAILSSVGVGLIYVVATLLSLIVNVILLTSGYGLYSIPLSFIFQTTIILIGDIIYIVWRYKEAKIKYSFSLKSISQLAKLSGFNFLGKMGSVIVLNVDSILVAKYIGAEFSAIYSITKKGPEISRTLVERPLIAMQSAITHAWGSGETEKIRVYITRLFIILIWVLGVIITEFIIFNKAFVSLWVGRELYAGNTINMLIIANIAVAVVIRLASSIIFSLGNIKQISNINFVQCFITLIALYIGTTFFGLIGLIVGQIVSSLMFSFWYTSFKAIKIISFSTETLRKLLKEVCIVLLLSLVIILTSYCFKLKITWFWFCFDSSVVLVFYFITLFLFSKQFKIEMINIKFYLNKYLIRVR